MLLGEEGWWPHSSPGTARGHSPMSCRHSPLHPTLHPSAAQPSGGAMLPKTAGYAFFKSKNRLCFPQGRCSQGGTFQQKQLETSCPTPLSSAHPSLPSGRAWLKGQDKKEGKTPNGTENAAAVSSQKCSHWMGKDGDSHPPQLLRAGGSVTWKGGPSEQPKTCRYTGEEQTDNHTLLQEHGDLDQRR